MKKYGIQNAIFLHPGSCTRIPYFNCADNCMQVQLTGCKTGGRGDFRIKKCMELSNETNFKGCIAVIPSEQVRNAKWDYLCQTFFFWSGVLLAHLESHNTIGHAYKKSPFKCY